MTVCCVDSYSYDLTHTLQFNMASCNLPPSASSSDADQSSSLSSSKCQFWQTDVGADRFVHDSSCVECNVEDASSVLQSDLFADDAASTPSDIAAAVDNNDQIDSNPSINADIQDSSASTESKAFIIKFFHQFVYSVNVRNY